MRNTHPFAKNESVNSVWREAFLRAKAQGALKGSEWKTAFSRNQPLTEQRNGEWKVVPAMEWAIRESETTEVLGLLEESVAVAQDLLPIAIRYHDHEAMEWCFNRTSPLNWRAWSATTLMETSPIRLTSWGEALAFAYPTDSDVAQKTMELCWGHFSKDPKFETFGFLHTELIVALLSKDQLTLAKTLLGKSAKGMTIHDVMTAAFKNQCGWFFEEASNALQAQNPHRWGKWARNAGQRWFKEEMPKLFEQGFRYYRDKAPWPREEMVRYKSFWKTVASWTAQQGIGWAVEKASARIFKERHRLAQNHWAPTRANTATKPGSAPLHEAWFVRVYEEDLLPQIKVPRKANDVMSFWANAGLTLDDSPLGEKTRALLERELLWTKHKTVLPSKKTEPQTLAL